MIIGCSVEYISVVIGNMPVWAIFWPYYVPQQVLISKSWKQLKAYKQPESNTMYKTS